MVRVKEKEKEKIKVPAAKAQLQENPTLAETLGPEMRQLHQEPLRKRQEKRLTELPTDHPAEIGKQKVPALEDQTAIFGMLAIV